MSASEQDVPYLPLVSETLANSHYVCEVRIGSSTVYGFERCESGWSWGQPGYGCSDGEARTWVGLVIPDLAACIDIQPVGMSVAPVDGGRFQRPEFCAPTGMWVPHEGLLVEVSGDSTLPERCASG